VEGLKDDRLAADPGDVDVQMNFTLYSYQGILINSREEQSMYCFRCLFANSFN
jgi:hypothetical protein